MGYTRWPRLCFLSHCVNAGVSKPRGDDTFCVIGNVGGGKLKDAAMRCVLRPVDASKSVCSSPLYLQGGFGERGIGKGVWKGTERRGRKGREKGDGIYVREFASLASEE